MKPWRPTFCSDCEEPLKKHPRAGQPRKTCGAACGAARNARQKREKAAWERQELREKKSMAEDLGPWLKGEVPR